MSTTYIYALKDSRDDSVRYVGMTKHPRNRVAQHLYLKFERNPHKRAWLEDMASANVKPELVILEEVNRTLSGEDYMAEKRWIRQLADNGEPLTNIKGRRLETGDLLSWSPE